MRVNRMNVDAMQLVAEDRDFEAVPVAGPALKLDPLNPFTMNNLAVADEGLGDFDNALKYYEQVADLHSSEHVVVTANRDWRGKSISAMAEASAKRLRNRMQQTPSAELEAATYNVRGVYEENENQWAAARSDFLRAYRSLPPARSPSTIGATWRKWMAIWNRLNFSMRKPGRPTMRKPAWAWPPTDSPTARG